MVDDIFINSKRLQPFTGEAWADTFITVMKLPIPDVVQQRGQLNYITINFFAGSDIQTGLPNAIDMPPIVSAAFALHQAANMIGGLCNDFWINDAAPLGRNGLQANHRNFAGGLLFILDEIIA